MTIRSTCPKCDYAGSERRWRCPKCGALLLGDRPIVAAIVYSLLLCGLAVPLALAEERSSIRRALVFALLAIAVVWTWVSQLRLRRLFTQYEDELPDP